MKTYIENNKTAQTITDSKVGAGKGVALPSNSRSPALHPPIQAKLLVGHPNDPLEYEADRAADQVVRMWQGGGFSSAPAGEGPPAKPITPIIRRRATSPAAGSVEASPQVAQQIQSAQSSGQALPGELLPPLEATFGMDFSGVRLHTDHRADALNRDIQARAFTTGQDIFFRHGEYQPGTTEGIRLLGHELGHVGQQGGGGMIRRQVAEGTFHISINGRAVEVDSTRIEGIIREQIRLGDIFLADARETFTDYDLYVRRGYSRERGQRGVAGERQEPIPPSQFQGLLNDLVVAWEDTDIIRSDAEIRSSELRNFHLAVRNFYNNLANAREALNNHDFDGSIRSLGQCRVLADVARRRWLNFINLTVTSAERSQFGIQTVQMAALGILSIANPAAGIVAIAGTQLIEQNLEIRFGLRQRIDWAGITFDVVASIVLNRALQFMGRTVSRELIRASRRAWIGPLARGIRRYSRLISRFTLPEIRHAISNIASGRLSTIIQRPLRTLLNRVTGERVMIWDEFWDEFATELLDYRTLIIDAITPGLDRSLHPASHASASESSSVTRPATPEAIRQAPAEPSALVDSQGRRIDTRGEVVPNEQPLRLEGLESTPDRPATPEAIRQAPAEPSALVDDLGRRLDTSGAVLQNEQPLRLEGVESTPPRPATPENTRQGLDEQPSMITPAQIAHIAELIRLQSLGIDQATGRWRRSETWLAQIIEQQQGVRLCRQTRDGVGDWVDQRGLVYDGVGADLLEGRRMHFEGDRGFIASIREHLAVPSYHRIVVVSRGLPPHQRATLDAYLSSLPENDARRIIRID